MMQFPREDCALSSIQTLQTRTPAVEQYGRSLAQAYSLFRVPDPSFAVANELSIDAKILLDAGMSHAFTFRWLLIAGTSYTVQPPKNATEREVLRSSIETEAIGQIKKLPEAMRNLARADLSGARFGYPRWKMKAMTFGGKTMIWAVPSTIADMDKNQFRLVTNTMTGNRGPDGRRVRVSAQGYDIHAEDWLDIDQPWRYIKHVFQDSQEYFGHGRGLRDALFYIWFAKSQLLVSMTEAADRFGTGYVDVAVDGLRDAQTKLPNPAVVAEWLSVVKRMREAGAFVRDKNDELSMLEANGTGWKLMIDLWHLLSGDADRLILGARLPTGGGDEGAGSLARAEVEKDSTTSIVRACRSSLEESVTDDLLGAFARLNVRNLAAYGLTECRPGRFTIEDDEEDIADEKPADERATAALAADLPLLRTEAYEAYGFTPPAPGDQIIKAAPPPAPAFPMGGGFPGGGRAAPPGGFSERKDWVTRFEDMKAEALGAAGEPKELETSDA